MKITALAGGIGAARFLMGLKNRTNPADLTIIVNTGDDFEWLGLKISPDLDTVVYTLAGLANRTTGWGMAGDTFSCLQRLNELGIDAWFRLGDRDLATHIYRTLRLAEGHTLSDVTREICARLAIREHVLPMSDSAVPTLVHTNEGTLAFQEYFVQRRCLPVIKGLTFAGASSAVPAPGILAALDTADAVLICPSNPFISIGPILAIPGIRDHLCASPATRIAITPIVAGRAIKGPAGKMMAEMGHEVSAASVAALYRDYIDVFVLDQQDQAIEKQIHSMDIDVLIADTCLQSHRVRDKLCRRILKTIGKRG